MKGTFIFLPQEKVIFGPGTINQLGAELDRLNRRRALVITGNSLAKKTNLLDRLKDILGSRLVEVFFPISQHVPRRDVLAAAQKAREAQADILISLGGSSPVDGTKGVALCLSADIDSEEQLDGYRRGGEAKSILQEPLPHIAVTTTLSAGEFTSGFGITNEKRRIKELYGAPQFIPRVVILDPEVTLFTPSWLWASTGMRAVDHAVERLYSSKHQPLVDALCLQSLRLLFKNLSLSIRDPANLEARLNCQLGAWLSILGIINVGIGISHAIGHQLGGLCHVPHGQTSCIILPHAMEFNLLVVAHRLALVAEAAGFDIKGMNSIQAAREAIAAVRNLVQEMGCPYRLRDVGVKEADLPLVAETVMKEVPLFENPRPIKDVEEVMNILNNAW